MIVTATTACRSCGSTDLAEAGGFGDIAVSDFKPKGEPFEYAPLNLLFCRACTLVQLSHMVDRESLYEHYYYRSGTSESMVESLADVVEDAQRWVGIEAGDVWLDIGANDGTLLGHVREKIPSMIRQGFEPAGNLWPELQHQGQLMGRYFPTMVGDRIVGTTMRAKIISSVACFYSVTDPVVFVQGIQKWLADDGIWVNQLAYWPSTMATNNFGDICHEHLTYWTATSMGNLLRQHDLGIRFIGFNDVNGGSMRITAIKDVDPVPGLTQDGGGLIAIKRFMQRVRYHKSQIRNFFTVAKREGKTVAGYGASTKGNTYLQYWGITPAMMPTIADRNPEKIGLYTPTGQRIIGEGDVRDDNPDYLFVLPWHFTDHFVQREQEYLQAGGRMVIPLPTLRIIGADERDSQSTPTATTVGAR